MWVSGCSHKKVHGNVSMGKCEMRRLRCQRLDLGRRTVWSETGLVPIRHVGVMLEGANRLAEAGGVAGVRRLALRAPTPAKTVDGVVNLGVARRVGLPPPQVDKKWRVMAIASYEERFVIPTTQREPAEDANGLRGGGCTDGNDCSSGTARASLVGGGKTFRAPTEFLS